MQPIVRGREAVSHLSLVHRSPRRSDPARRASQHGLISSPDHDSPTAEVPAVDAVVSWKLNPKRFSRFTHTPFHMCVKVSRSSLSRKLLASPTSSSNPSLCEQCGCGGGERVAGMSGLCNTVVLMRRFGKTFVEGARRGSRPDSML